MPELPVSVRVALWTTAAYAGELPLADALDRATPDIDVVSGRIERLATWRDLGERVVLVALPRPGDPGLLPRGADVLAAATEVGECVFVPGLGDALVPTLSRMGPSEEPLDTVLGIRWAAYSGEPLPVHAVDALGLRTGERLLHEALAEAIEALEGLDSPAWSTEQAAAVREAGSRGGDWGLPTGLHPGARRVLTRAASLVEAADLGLAPAVQHTVGVHSVTRERILTTLRRVAERTLAEATCVAALHLAGWRGPDRD